MADSLRIGVIGAGRRGTALAHAAARLPGVVVAAVVDADMARSNVLAESWKSAVYSGWQSMLIFEKLDAVIVASPSAVHADQTLTAIGQMLHVYVERPPALDLATAQRIGEKAEELGRIVQVGLQHRYSSLVDPWRHALTGRAISLVHAHVYRGQVKTAQTADAATTVPTILDEGMHLLDLCRWLVGEIGSVAAHYGHALASGADGDSAVDSAAISVQFRSGASGTLSITHAMPLPIPGHMAIDVVAEGPLLLRYTGSELQVVQESGVETWALQEPPDLAAMAAFVEAVRTGNRAGLRLPYVEAVRSLQLALACDESASTGHVVTL